MWLLLSRGWTILFATLFLTAVLFKSIFPGDDPYRCRAVANTGQWIDTPDEEGNRFPFRRWQPDGCMFHEYSSEDIRRCMGGRKIVIGGDSTSRNVAYGLGRLLDRDEAEVDREINHKGDQFNLSYHGVTIQRYPNVWLRGYEDDEQKAFMEQIDEYTAEMNDPKSIEEQKGAAMVYLAGGVWYTNPDDKRDHDGRMALYREKFTKLSDALAFEGKGDMFTDAMDPVDGVGNQVFYAPPAGPRYLGNKTDKITEINRRRGEVFEMQDWLHETDGKWNAEMIWAVPATTHGQNLTWKDPLGTGFHVLDNICETRANILLNLRCNAKLDREKSYPNNRTCCTDYGIKPFVQVLVLAVAMVYLVACVVCSLWDLCARRDEPRWMLLDMKAGTFALALLMCYYADRTQFMAKGAKVWSYFDFAALCLPCIILALATIRKTRPAPKGYKEISSEAMEPVDEPFLSRDQTDEWKGWMQFVILIYHYTNANTPAVYTVVRVMVASYLFQTGYGHTLFYLNKKDFSLNRVAAVLLRLNLLSCSLAYIMDTDYMLYYFSPLVTFWYLVVYATMAIGSERCNDDTQLIIVKIGISAMVLFVVTLATPFMEWLFWLLQAVFKIQWSYSEWHYRVSMDILIVYVGMLMAVAVTHLQIQIRQSLRITLAAAGAVVIGHYFVTASNTKTSSYRMWHPYISFLPILAFVALRNVSATVRNYHSRAMAWLGRCSLETYTLQFHLLLAADTNGVLVIDGFYGDGTLSDRWRSLIIIVPIFLWISSATSNATGYLVKGFMSDSSSHKMVEADAADSPLRKTMKRWTTLPMLRIGTVLLIMWLLNVLSPSHAEGPAPDGFTPHRANATTTTVGSPAVTPH